MIISGQKHHLGNKALFFMLLQNLSPAIFLLVLVFIILISWNSLSLGLENSNNTLTQYPFLISYSVLSYIPSAILIIVLLAIVLFGVGALMALLQYRFFTFTLEEFDLRLRKGIFNIQEITIPYRQIQNVDIVRSFLYRIFGISKLVIMSAGHDEDLTDNAVTSTVFNPIDKELAEEVRIPLERHIGIQVIENTEKADREEQKAKIIT
jgi:uncharacterized membrane protein YdbT with pleckstrin-like domain